MVARLARSLRLARSEYQRSGRGYQHSRNGASMDKELRHIGGDVAERTARLVLEDSHSTPQFPCRPARYPRCPAVPGNRLEKSCIPVHDWSAGEAEYRRLWCWVSIQVPVPAVLD